MLQITDFHFCVLRCVIFITDIDQMMLLCTEHCIYAEMKSPTASVEISCSALQQKLLRNTMLLHQVKALCHLCHWYCFDRHLSFANGITRKVLYGWTDFMKFQGIRRLCTREKLIVFGKVKLGFGLVHQLLTGNVWNGSGMCCTDVLASLCCSHVTPLFLTSFLCFCFSVFTN